MSDILVVKIGGSTLGAHDTTLEDVVALQRRGLKPVVVHGGGALISEWLKLHDVPTRFERGLRVTDERTLEVVVAVLAGLVNKGLVAALAAAGGRAVGLSGADGGLLKARLLDEKLGFVGDVAEADTRPLLDLLDDGFVPVVAPVAVEWRGEAPTGQLLNVNADDLAAGLGGALRARALVLLSDAPGLRLDGRVVARLAADEVAGALAHPDVKDGMRPKLRAAAAAIEAGAERVVIGAWTGPDTLTALLAGEGGGAGGGASNARRVDSAADVALTISTVWSAAASPPAAARAKPGPDWPAVGLGGSVVRPKAASTPPPSWDSTPAVTPIPAAAENPESNEISVPASMESVPST